MLLLLLNEICVVCGELGLSESVLFVLDLIGLLLDLVLVILVLFSI